MLYVKEGKLYTPTDIKLAHKNISFATGEFCAPEGYMLVEETPQPAYDYRTHKIDVDGAIEVDGKMVRNWVVIELTQEEKDYILNNASDNIRSERDRKLIKSDWTQGKDIPAEVSTKWATYRQALRDIPSQPGFPWNITWPVEPK